MRKKKFLKTCWHVAALDAGPLAKYVNLIFNTNFSFIICKYMIDKLIGW